MPTPFYTLYGCVVLRKMGKQSVHRSKRNNNRSKGAKARWMKQKVGQTKSPNIFDDISVNDDELLQNEGNLSNKESDIIAGNMSSDDTALNSDSECNAEVQMKRNPLWCVSQYEPRYFERSKQKDSGVLSSDECRSIENVCLDREPCPSEPSPITGNRIVELGYVMQRTINLQYEHSLICTTGKLFIKNECRRGTGLVSTVVLGCTQCSKIYEVCTEDPTKPVSVINTGVVWGTMATGSTYTHLSEFLSCVDIPVLPQKMFYEKEDELGKEWKSSLLESMTAAGIKERDHAIANQQIDEAGIPYVTVYLDGSWSKRSYGNNYSSLSGMVGIIGKHTGELLFVSVRNKFCIICCRAEHNNVTPQQHVCFKNWTGSAPAMEADMVVEGFNCSEQMHGVRYLKFIADGDSSVFANIKNKVTYGQAVRKVECTNHALKNYGKHLLKLKNDTQINLSGRKLLTTDKIKRLTKRAKCSIYEHSKGNQDVALFREDLRNGLHHVFGDHSKCRQGICNHVGDQSDNKIPQLQSTTIYNHLYGVLNLLVRKANLLIENENNNRAERLMNIVSRFNMGKRLNLIQRGSYERRVHMSGLRYNHAYKWHSAPWKKVTQRSPGQHFKKFINSQGKHSKGVKRRLFHNVQTNNTDYGVNAEQPEEDEGIIRSESEQFIESLKVTPEEQDKIQRLSVGQFGNEIYEAKRKYRLTASMFGRVINRLAYTPCHAIVKSCLTQQNFMTDAMQYGIAKEKVAIGLFSEKSKLTVEESGLWIDVDYGFLGASPDGLVGTNAIVEVKCLHAASLMNNEIRTVHDAVKLKKAKFLQLKDDNISLKVTHPYYYQVQGQLNITRREKCYFIVYISDSVELYVEEINRNEHLWHTKMLPPLIQFYKECIGPEIIRNNLGKKLKCVDPPFITTAIEEREKQKKLKAACSVPTATNS